MWIDSVFGVFSVWKARCFSLEFQALPSFVQLPFARKKSLETLSFLRVIPRKTLRRIAQKYHFVLHKKPENALAFVCHSERSAWREAEESLKKSLSECCFPSPSENSLYMKKHEIFCGKLILHKVYTGFAIGFPWLFQ